MHAERRFVLDSGEDARWIRVYVQPIGDVWAPMAVDEDEAPPAPGQLKGIVFFGGTAEEAESNAELYLDRSGPTN